MYITLEKRKELLKKSEETTYSSLFAGINEAKRRDGYTDDELGSPCTYTKEALEAQRILRTAIFVLTREQKEKLEEIARRKSFRNSIHEVNESKRRSGYREDELDSPYQYTKEALEAQEILSRCITVEELRKQKAEQLDALIKEIEGLDKMISDIEKESNKSHSE